jgi:hypothetical protein
MDPVRIMEKGERLDWEYDEEADVLYLSIGKPRNATGVDIGKGLWSGSTRRDGRSRGSPSWASEHGS